MNIAKYTKQEFSSLPKTYTVMRTDATGHSFLEHERKVRWYHRFTGLPFEAREQFQAAR